MINGMINGMIYGILFGCGGIVSYIYTNHNLLKDAIEKDEIISISQTFPISPYNKKYSKIQKIHYFFTILMFILFNGLAVDAYFKGYTLLVLDFISLKTLPVDVGIAFLMNNCMYYYYHRLLHTPFLYKYIHSYHHAFSEPEPFDSLVGHPIDHTFAGIFQIAPIFIYKMHLLSFLLYSSLLSYIGILDHSGKFIQYFSYKSIDHHIHHKFPLNNFGTCIPLFDMLHGTYKRTMIKIKD